MPKLIRTPPTPMQQYENALQALKQWDEQHQSLLEERDTLLATLQQCENALKADIRLARSSQEGRLVNAQFQVVKDRWYDVAVLKQYIPAPLITAMGIIKIEQTVDEKALKAVVAAGKVPESVLELAYRDKEIGVRVVIKPRG